jgi:hypothetical protein
MEQTECSETSAHKIQTPGNYPEENIQHTEHGESLKSGLTDWFRVTEVESVFWAVRTEFLYETEMFRLKRVNIKCNERIVRNIEFEIIGQ